MCISIQTVTTRLNSQIGIAYSILDFDQYSEEIVMIKKKEKVER